MSSGQTSLLSGSGLILAACLAAITSSIPSANAAEESPHPRTTYGEIGLLDMPSARMAPDGELSMTVGLLNNTQRYNLGFQFLPWLEGSFRYTHAYGYFGTKELYDRSLSFKMRLFQETEYLPQVSVGIRDILGTGVYSSEYFAGSKRVGDFDFTLGLGWGRLGSSNALPNPFAKTFSSFETRSDFGAQGGTVNFGQFFHGPSMGVFGGVVWRTPIDNLNVLLEYSSDRYLGEKAAGGLEPRSPINIGLSYQLYDSIKISAGWLYGSSFGLSVSMFANPTAPLPPTYVGPALPPPLIRSNEEQTNALAALLEDNRPEYARRFARVLPSREAPVSQLNQSLRSVGSVDDYEIVGRTLTINSSEYKNAVAKCPRYAQAVSRLRNDVMSIAITDFSSPDSTVSFCSISPEMRQTATAPSPANANNDLAQLEVRVRADLRTQNIGLVALDRNGSTLAISYTNTRYFSEAQAAGRAVRVLMAAAPADVEIFHLFPIENGMTSNGIRVPRSSLERATQFPASAPELATTLSLVTSSLSDRDMSIPQAAWAPKLTWSIGPSVRQIFFDPRTPLQVQLFVLANANVEIYPGFNVGGTGELNLFNNFNTRTPSDSVLPHVRSDVSEYLKEGANGIRELEVSYNRKLGENLFGEIRAGYLEEMFAGAGGQILWRPNNGRWSFGLDAYQVWQRDFDKLFGLRDYQTLTGHVSAYYQSAWHGLNFAVHAGRYLANDYGATFEVSRRFSTGVEIGAFATFTNVPFSKFGEGSFDKGIIIRIPFQWAIPVYTRSQYSLTLRSITRDGGARLVGDDSLYQRMLRTSSTEITNHLSEIIEPTN